MEKYSSWSFNLENEILGHKDGGLSEFDKNDLLTIITIYWMTNSISSSVRYYKVNFAASFTKWPQKFFSNAIVPEQVKCGVQYSRNELVMHPYVELAKRYVNLKQYIIAATGGHFAAFQIPELTAYNFAQFIKDY